MNSDGEEEEEGEGSWLEGKGELGGWLVLKAAESELKLDNNFGREAGNHLQKYIEFFSGIEPGTAQTRRHG